MLNEYFGLAEKHTTFKIEIVAGLTTFLTMAYIVFVNPSILSLEGIELTDIERMDKQALIAVTCLVSGLATIIVGIFAKAPIAMAPGMGLNAFFDMFDSVGTLVACCHQADMVDKENRIEGLDRLLGIDAIATMIGALFGTSTTTAYMESAAGIEQGGRTGLTAVVTGTLFLLTVLFVPVVGIVPGYATAPALIMVGLFMMKEVKRIDFTNMEEAFPAFIIMVMIALSYSISTGLAFGFVSFTLVKTVSGKVKEIRAAMWIIAVLSVLFLTLDHIPGMIERLVSLV
jgi:xanthine/uracil/vitamin C permease (AzgA family)